MRPVACQAAMNSTYLWIERVGTEDHIADLPSMQKYDLLQELGAQWRPPAVASLFMSVGGSMPYSDAALI